MTGARRVALVAAAGLLPAFLLCASRGASAQEPRRSTITIVDHLGPGQSAETIAVYLAGVLAGTLHVDAGRPDDSLTVTVPAMDRLPFTLCGKLVRREPDGSASAHAVDNGGTLTGYADGTWAAVTLGDLAFTLEDTDGRGESSYSATPACSAAVS